MHAVGEVRVGEGAGGERVRREGGTLLRQPLSNLVVTREGALGALDASGPRFVVLPIGGLESLPEAHRLREDQRSRAARARHRDRGAKVPLEDGHRLVRNVGRPVSGRLPGHRVSRRGPVPEGVTQRLDQKRVRRERDRGAFHPDARENFPVPVRIVARERREARGLGVVHPRVDDHEVRRKVDVARLERNQALERRPARDTCVHDIPAGRLEPGPQPRGPRVRVVRRAHVEGGRAARAHDPVTPDRLRHPDLRTPIPARIHADGIPGDLETPSRNSGDDEIGVPSSAPRRCRENAAPSSARVRSHAPPRHLPVTRAPPSRTRRKATANASGKSR